MVTMIGISFCETKSNLIEKAKQETYQSKIEEGISDPKSIWKLFKELGANGKGNNSESGINIKIGEQLVIHEADLTQLFNAYFVNVASSIKEPTVHSNFVELQHYVESKVTSNTEFTIPLTNVTFVRNFLTNLNVNKSTGLDNIGPRVLTIAANVLTPSLIFIVNKSILFGEFPCSWKEAKVKPLFKSGAKDDVNNYRPISILPTISN